MSCSNFFTPSWNSWIRKKRSDLPGPLCGRQFFLETVRTAVFKCKIVNLPSGTGVLFFGGSHRGS